MYTLDGSDLGGVKQREDILDRIGYQVQVFRSGIGVSVFLCHVIEMMLLKNEFSVRKHL